METINRVKKKIFFLGTSTFAQAILVRLIENKIPISRVITQPDREFGRKQELQAPPVKESATAFNIQVHQFEQINDLAMDFFTKQAPDLIIVAAYGIILPTKLINLPPYGCINVHPSKLPELRGPSPIQTALLQGRKKTGTTIMLMDEKIDHGPILAQKDVSIRAKESYLDLELKLAKISSKLLSTTIKKLFKNKIISLEQNHHEATFTKIIFKQDGKITWSNTAQQIYDQYRAFFLWPKVFSLWNMDKNKAHSEKKISFHDLAYDLKIDFPDRHLGEVFFDPKKRLVIQTEQGVIIPKVIQLEGKKPTDIKSFINGYPNFIGSVLN